MRSGSLVIAVAMFVTYAGHARAATLTPSGTTVVVSCGMKIQVTAANSGQTLELALNDPIFSETCQGSGLQIFNTGASKYDLDFTVVCPSGTIKGAGSGTGILLTGPNLSLSSCNVDGFKRGIVAEGDDFTIENCGAAHSKLDGFQIRDPLSPNNDLFLGAYFASNQAANNGGWGFKIRGKGIDTSLIDYTTGNLAVGNGKGGFSVAGLLHYLDTNTATSNLGPGFEIITPSCCGFTTLTDAQALLNTGPGVVFAGRDDGLNCAALGGGPSVCFPETLDVSGTISSAFNTGTCPTGTLQVPALLSQQICAVVLRKPCSAATLAGCLF